MTGRRVPRSAWVPALLGSAVVFPFLTACASCAGGPAVGWSVEFYSEDWALTHPGSVIHACLDSACEDVPAGSSGPGTGYLMSHHVAPGDAVTLHVTGNNLDASARFILLEQDVHTGCGNLQNYQTTVFLDSKGTLIVPVAARR